MNTAAIPGRYWQRVSERKMIMAIVNMKDLLAQARRENRGCGSFSVGNMEMVLGAVEAAEHLDTPIIIQIAESRLKHSPLRLMGPMMVEAARRSSVDIAVHLDHAQSLEVMRQALEYGFTSIMMDGSACPFDDNILKTKAALALAERYGAAVEAELGLVGKSEDGTEDFGIRCTNPGDAEVFCMETGVSALAIAIGNAHGNYPVAPRLRFDILEQIHMRTDTPLVLHGGSGITDEDFRKAITKGILKVNIATASFNRLVDHSKRYLDSEGEHDYFKLNGAMVEGVYENVAHHIKVFNMER